MKNLFYDFTTFIKSLSLIDVLFIVALIGLVVLIVTLIYIVKMNNEEEIDTIDEYNDDDELDLASISKEIEENPTKPITLNDYEKEQEEKAIISYDELIKTKDIPLEEINYKNEEDLDGLTVKTVDQDELTKPIELPKIKLKNIKKDEKEDKKLLIGYEEEEEFLKTLKKLDNLLN